MKDVIFQYIQKKEFEIKSESNDELCQKIIGEILIKCFFGEENFTNKGFFGNHPAVEFLQVFNNACLLILNPIFLIKLKLLGNIKLWNFFPTKKELAIKS